MMVSLFSIVLMLVLYHIVVLLTAYYLQHPPKEMFGKSVRTLLKQCSFCFFFYFAPYCDEND